MSDTTWPHVLNLSNSIIGITVLAMPFCFKECGVLLGVVLLFFSTWLTLTSCQLLMKAGIISRRRSYGFLAYYTHGAPGKFAVEVGMIGLQIGTLIAQVVIIGDLGPAIISKVTGLQNSSHLRTALIILLCLCIGLPLGLLKNLTTLSHASTLCISFYSIFVIYVMFLATPNLFKGDWLNKVNLWRTEGLFKCLPIFSFAFGCQTQLFILYDALAEPSLKAMNSIVGSAVNMCTVAYLLVGFFGYVAFCDIDVSGDIITHFDANVVTDVLKLGFVISIAISFPLIIYPCRNSLYTLLFPQKPKHDENIEPQRPVIPELHFKAITVAIVIGAMITGILVPNVEFVLAMNGATMGTLICYIFPAMFFLRVMTTSSDGKNLAQLVFIFGFTIMLLCTYTTLNSQDVGHIQPAVDIMDKPKLEDGDLKKPVIEQPQLADGNLSKDDDNMKKKPPDKVAAGEPVKDVNGHESSIQQQQINDTRIEPPNPKEPVEDPYKTKKDGQKKYGGKLDSSQSPPKKVEDKLIEKVVDDKVQEIKKEVEKAEKVQEEVDKKQKDLLKQLENQQKESKKLLEEQKQILEELKQHKEEVHKQDEKVGQGQQMVQQPALGQGQQVVQQQAVGQGQQLLQQPGVNQGQQVVQQPAVGQGKQVAQQLGVNQGQQVAQQPAVGQGQQVAQQPGVNQGQQVAQQPAVGQGQQVAQQPWVNQEQQVAQQPAVGQGQQVVQQPGVNVNQGQQVAQQGMQQQVVNQGQPQLGVQGQQPLPVQGQVGQQVQKQPVVAQGQQPLALQGQSQVVAQRQPVGQQSQQQQLTVQGQVEQQKQQQPTVAQSQQISVALGQGLKQQAAIQGQQQINQQQNNVGQQQANDVGGKSLNVVENHNLNEKNKIAEDKSKLQKAMNEIQKVLDEVQKDKPNQEDKPLNRQKRDTDTNAESKIQQEKQQVGIDDNNQVKNEEMRRKKLSFDEGAEDNQVLYEALKDIDKHESHHPVVDIGAFRSLKYKQE